MWKYIKKYLPYAIIAALFMVGEVLMDLIQPKIMSDIVDNGVLGLNNGGSSDLSLILHKGLLMIGLVLMGGFFGSMNNVFVNLSGQNIGNEMRKDCFRKIMTFSFRQVDEISTGSIVTRVTNDVTQVQNLVSQFVRGMIRTSMLTFGSIYFMFRLNQKFGLTVFCASPIIMGVIVFCLVKANPLMIRLQSQLDTINEIMQEDITGIRMIKACVREIYEKVRFKKANDELIGTQLRVLVIFAFMNPIINALMYGVVALILLIGSHDVTAGAASPGNIMAAITYTTQLLNGILSLVMLFQTISRGLASWKRITEILNSQSELADGSFDGETRVRGEIELRNVSFQYPGSETTVLKNINLTVHSGETLAIMGATGCGKTTLVNLIPRFYDVTEGEVLVDGVDVREYKQQFLREKIAVAMQKSELFSTSIAENILWGAPEAKESEMKKATEVAQAEEFVSSFPETYDTQVAERGMSLSGGQKQRVALARAVLKSAEILMIDDATSALDLKTEANFYDALQAFSPDSTKIIVAQRIASVRRADRIAVIENGSIAACGTHEALLKTCKTYKDIYDSQIGEDENHG